MIAGPRPSVGGVTLVISTTWAPRSEIEDPRRAALDQAGNDPYARALIRDQDDCLDLWDISEGITADDPAEMIRAAEFRHRFWADFAAGGDPRVQAMRGLRQELLDWLEAPHRTVEAWWALAHEHPDLDLTDGIVQAIDMEHLRGEWRRRLRAPIPEQRNGR